MIDDKEIQQIKEKHLGINKERKKVNRPGDKFKQVFTEDWDASEDTSRDQNSLYMNRQAPVLLHGKGFVGGVDRELQQKQSQNKGSIVPQNTVTRNFQ